MNDTTNLPPLPEPAAWRWPVRKLRGVEWRYTLYETRRNAVPLYTADQLRAAVLAERERWAKVCEDVATHGRYQMEIDHINAAFWNGYAAGADQCATDILESDK